MVNKRFQLGILTLVLVLLFSHKLSAQDNIQSNRGFLHFYDTKLFQWNFNFWGGLTLNF